MPRHRRLKNVGIKPRTLRLYRLDISLFCSHLDLRGIGAPPSLAELDSVVANYFNHLYQEQEGISRAGWLLSGLKRSTRECSAMVRQLEPLRAASIT